MHKHINKQSMLVYISIKKNFLFKTCYSSRYSFLNKKNTNTLTIINKLTNHGNRLGLFKKFKQFYTNEFNFFEKFVWAKESKADSKWSDILPFEPLPPTFFTYKVSAIKEFLTLTTVKPFLRNFDTFFLWKFQSINPMFTSKLIKNPKSAKKNKNLKIIYVTEYRRLMVVNEFLVNYLKFRKKRNYRSVTLFKPLTHLLITPNEDTVLESFKLKVYASFLTTSS